MMKFENGQQKPSKIKKKENSFSNFSITSVRMTRPCNPSLSNNKTENPFSLQDDEAFDKIDKILFRNTLDP